YTDKTARPTVLSSAGYLPLPEPAEYKFSQRRGRLPGNKEAQNQTLAAELHNVLSCWLQFPAGQSNLQGTFVRHLLNAFENSDVLLLPGVYDAFLRVRETVFGKNSQVGRAALLDPTTLDAFAQNLKAQPLCDPDSTEYTAMQMVSEKLDLYQESWRRMEGITQGLSECPAYALDTPEYKTAFTSAQNVYSDLDFYLPFRQHAPEIVNLFSSQGILHPDVVDEVGAIASLWCFRAIFYRTRFSQEHPHSLFFNDYAEWEELHDELLRDPQIALFNQGKDRYFCNTRAYGAPTTRSVSCAEAYFAHEPEWLKLFDKHDPGWKMDYADAYRFTQSNKIKNRKAQKLLPQIGPLTGMLITSDLVYAGKVAMPSASKMGEMVHLLDKGADTCLRHFGLLHKSSPLEDTVTVFEDLYDAVWEELTEDERTRMTFDPIMFEHTLCEFQRCYE
ncbi:hypothetical protein OH77DRAFT_1432209, partial [Trametes cingulata]